MSSRIMNDDVCQLGIDIACTRRCTCNSLQFFHSHIRIMSSDISVCHHIGNAIVEGADMMHLKVAITTRAARTLMAAQVSRGSVAYMWLVQCGQPRHTHREVSADMT